MSDDDFYDDDFDDDSMWFEDGERELVDDLAGGTTHSPVYFDQLTFDALESGSDWEYYTDEYFDDDPSIMHTQMEDKAPEDRKSTKLSSLNPGRKRRRGTVKTTNLPERSYGSPMVERDPNSAIKSFYGVVWRASSHSTSRIELYEPGQGEKVALLKNWREIFMNPQPKTDRKPQATHQAQLSSRPRRKLGRLGGSTLGRNSRGKVTRKKDPENDGSNSFSGNDGGFDGDVEDGAGFATGPRHTPPPSFLSVSQQELLKMSKKGTRSTSGQRPDAGSRLNVVMSAYENPISSITAPSTAEPNGPTGSRSRSPHDAFDASDSSHVAQQVTSEQSVHTAQANLSPSTSRRKRKASAPLDDLDGGVGGTVDGLKRSKRATTRRTADIESMPAPLSHSTSSNTKRSLRERKKL